VVYESRQAVGFGQTAAVLPMPEGRDCICIRRILRGTIMGRVALPRDRLEELTQRDKGDAGKIRIARRLRSETSVPLKWIAEELKMGSWTYVASRLNRKQEIKRTDDQNQLNLA